MSYHAAPTRGRGGSVRGTGLQREAPRMPEDRDATVSHGTRRGGLGLPPLVLSSSRGRGRGGPPARGKGGVKSTGSSALPPRERRGAGGGWGKASLPPRPRPVDTYIPPRPRSPPSHQRWDSPPAHHNAQPEPGPSNYAQTSLPPSRPIALTAPPQAPSTASSTVDKDAVHTVEPTSQIVAMKFKPKIPKAKAPIRQPEPNPSLAVHNNEEAAMNRHVGSAGSGPSSSRPGNNGGLSKSDQGTGADRQKKDIGPIAGPSRPRPALDEKEDIEVEEDVKPVLPDTASVSSPSPTKRQDGGTIDESRNDGVLVMWPHQIPECFPPNKPPGRTKARQEWRSAREAELKVKGIRVVRALWRDDGVGLHWERAAQPRAKSKTISSTVPTATDVPLPSPSAHERARPRAPTPLRTAPAPPVPVSPRRAEDSPDKSEIVIAPDPDARSHKPSKKADVPATPPSAKVKTKVKIEPGSELSKSERKALKKEAKRKREANEAEEAAFNGQETPEKKRKTKGERKKEKAARAEAESTGSHATKSSEASKDKERVSHGDRMNSPPKPVKTEPGESSSSIDPPKAKRLISLTEAAPSASAFSAPVRASSLFTPCPPPVAMRISAGPRLSPEKPAAPQPRPTPSAPFRSSSSLPNPIKPYQAPTSITNPIKPYQPPSATPQPQPRPQASSSSSIHTTVTPSARQLPTHRPIPKGPRADKHVPSTSSPAVRPQVSRSITPSNISNRFDELKRALHAKMVEMDNWTSMLTDMPDSAELTQRQIDKTRTECFDLQKQMREERERTAGTEPR